MKSRFDSNLTIETLEDFVGVYGNDDQIDYYREECGGEESSHEVIEKKIIDSFSDKRNADIYTNKRKAICDKYTHIFFVRHMYDLSKEGNRKPGWYEGSPMIRKISQGNPRAFIQIMNILFEKARKSLLTPKAQHGRR